MELLSIKDPSLGLSNLFKHWTPGLGISGRGLRFREWGSGSSYLALVDLLVSRVSLNLGRLVFSWGWACTGVGSKP